MTHFDTAQLLISVFFGVLGFLVGQGALKRGIEPWVEFQRVKGRIAFGLIQFANHPSVRQTGATDADMKELLLAKHFYRTQGAELMAAFYALPWCIRWILRSSPLLACRELVGMSDTIGFEFLADYKRHKALMVKALGIPLIEDPRFES